jgi:guanylate kinase
MHKFRSQFIVLSAPSGAGKTTIANILTDRHDDLAISVSATTRTARSFEKNGRDYHFLSEEEFRKNIDENNFLEFEEVHGDLYGTLKNQVDDLINKGKTVVFDIDVKGALAIKKKIFHCHSYFYRTTITPIFNNQT